MSRKSDICLLLPCQLVDIGLRGRGNITNEPTSGKLIFVHMVLQTSGIKTMLKMAMAMVILKVKTAIMKLTVIVALKKNMTMMFMLRMLTVQSYFGLTNHRYEFRFGVY